MCDRFVADRDDMIIKAMSWALRALAVRDPNAVERYIQANETRLPARVLREVRNKLRTGVKNPKPHAVARTPRAARPRARKSARD